MGKAAGKSDSRSRVPPDRLAAPFYRVDLSRRSFNEDGRVAAKHAKAKTEAESEDG